MQKIRNIAVIAHVDHGKTTLVDGLLQQSGTFAEHEDIIDTPGHADFGGEVERVLKMVDGALILVDAYEGVMPQTKFVVKKMLALGITPIVVINKIDKPSADPERVVDEVFDLFADMGATDEQQDFTVVYAAARDGIAKMDMSEEDGDFTCLFRTILDKVPEPVGDRENPAQAQVFTLDYDNYVGTSGIARVFTVCRSTQQKRVISLHSPVLRQLRLVTQFVTLLTQWHLTRCTSKSRHFLLFFL
jgi:GTP-binding protein